MSSENMDTNNVMTSHGSVIFIEVLAFKTLGTGYVRVKILDTHGRT